MKIGQSKNKERACEKSHGTITNIQHGMPFCRAIYNHHNHHNNNNPTSILQHQTVPTFFFQMYAVIAAFHCKFQLELFY